jgi:hypothetical protein
VSLDGTPNFLIHTWTFLTIICVAPQLFLCLFWISIWLKNRCLQQPCFKNLCKIAQASKNSNSNAQDFLSDLLTNSWFHSMLFALPSYQFPYIVMNRCLYLKHGNTELVKIYELDFLTSFWGHLWGKSVKILACPSPTGYMLWSFGLFLLLHWSKFPRFLQTKWVVFPRVLNFNRYLTTSVTNSHFTHEPRAMTMESWDTKRKSVQRPSQDTSKIVQCGHGPSSANVKSYVSGPSTKCNPRNFHFHTGPHTRLK